MESRSLVVVTGASSGIGAETARRFSDEGHPLLLVSRRREALEALGLPNSMILASDVNDHASFERGVAAAEQKYGPVEVLVNNAGVMALSSVTDQDPVRVQEMFDTNCVAPMKNAQIVLATMLRERRGTIVNLGSIAGRQIYPNHTVYNGTKFAIHAMTEGLRREVAAYGVRVILVSPGMVDTGLLSGTDAGQVLSDYQSYKASIGNGLRPRDIADAIYSAYAMPEHVTVREIVVAPTVQDA